MSASNAAAEPALLAVDVGLRCGLAYYDRDGRLHSYRSTNFGTAARLRRGCGPLLAGQPELELLVLDGGGPLAEIWQRAAERTGLNWRQVSAEQWRRKLLLDRDQRSGRLAKQRAGGIARAVIAWCGAPAPTSLRHDAAEAILIGLYAVHELDWLKEFPWPLARYHD